MIFSLKKEFIFVHNPKAAGSSIQKALRPYDDGQFIKARTKHETITNFKKRNPDLNYSQFFIFGFVRNPYDRFCSLYYFLKKQPENFPQIETVKDVNEFTKRIDENWLKERYSIQPQHTYFDDSTNIFYFETLDSGFNVIADTIGISEEVDLGHENKSTDHLYTELLNDESKDILRKRYRKDFKKFGYKE